jgi:ubiquitin-like 1-activating enzyme E1 B
MTRSTSTRVNDSSLLGIEATLGKDVMTYIQNSKILVVGSGGIGCEVLKNLALSGFRHVEVMDMDTIDVSNLNRQFLFRSQHVGQPKCHVACQVSQRMISPSSQHPKIQYIPHHENICDLNSNFNVPFVSQFNIVFNALDNITARRRVNRLCLAANVPLIEAGTTGYLGQVKVIHKGSGIECYECVTQEPPKVYPICTIRSTPTQPVHCIVWAKELYKLLFCTDTTHQESMLFEGRAGGHAANEDNEDNTNPDNQEPSTYMDAVLTYRKYSNTDHDSAILINEKEEIFASIIHLLLDTIFNQEIQKQLNMGRYKAASKPPNPLSPQLWLTMPIDVETSNTATTTIWSLEECIAIFRASLWEGILPKHGQLVTSDFDKDDSLAMKFVTAASNLRSYIFSITPLQSEYSAKGIAGNIIPAIATTNAICAGLQVLQAFCILQAQQKLQQSSPSSSLSLKDTCRYIDCVRNRSGRSGWYLLSSTLRDANPQCFVCRNATLSITLNVHRWTFRSFLQTIIKARLGFAEPSVILADNEMVWEEGEDADSHVYEQNLDRKLPNLPCGGINHGTIIRIEDFSQDLEVDICITHIDQWPDDDDKNNTHDGTEEKYLVGGETSSPAVKNNDNPASSSVLHQDASIGNKNGNNTSRKDEEDDDDDILEIVDANPNGDEKLTTLDTIKEPSMERPSKRRKASDTNDTGHTVIILDD